MESEVLIIQKMMYILIESGALAPEEMEKIGKYLLAVPGVREGLHLQGVESFKIACGGELPPPATPRSFFTEVLDLCPDILTAIKTVADEEFGSGGQGSMYVLSLEDLRQRLLQKLS